MFQSPNTLSESLDGSYEFYISKKSKPFYGLIFRVKPQYLDTVPNIHHNILLESSLYRYIRQCIYSHRIEKIAEINVDFVDYITTYAYLTPELRGVFHKLFPQYSGGYQKIAKKIKTMAHAILHLHILLRKKAYKTIIANNTQIAVGQTQSLKKASYATIAHLGVGGGGDDAKNDGDIKNTMSSTDISTNNAYINSPCIDNFSPTSPSLYPSYQTFITSFNAKYPDDELTPNIYTVIPVIYHDISEHYTINPNGHSDEKLISNFIRTWQYFNIIV
jgi:hypothetical protein